MEGRGDLTMASISLQDLRRRLYVKAKADKDWRFWGLYVQPPPKVLQTDGRHCQVAPAFHVVGGVAEQQGPPGRALARPR